MTENTRNGETELTRHIARELTELPSRLRSTLREERPDLTPDEVKAATEEAMTRTLARLVRIQEATDGLQRSLLDPNNILAEHLDDTKNLDD